MLKKFTFPIHFLEMFTLKVSGRYWQICLLLPLASSKFCFKGVKKIIFSSRASSENLEVKIYLFLFQKRVPFWAAVFLSKEEKALFKSFSCYLLQLCRSWPTRQVRLNSFLLFSIPCRGCLLFPWLLKFAFQALRMNFSIIQKFIRSYNIIIVKEYYMNIIIISSLDTIFIKLNKIDIEHFFVYR